MLSEAMYKEVKRLFHENEIEMENFEIELYANMFEIISIFTSRKLSVEEIFTSYDFLSDILHNRVPEFAVHVPKEERITVQLRAMELLEETKGKLTMEEKEKYAFCVFFANCVKMYDEKTNTVSSGLTAFTDMESILGEYEFEKETNPARFQFLGEENNVPGEPFGYSINNPVLAVSVGASYDYLNRLYVSENEVSYNRIGSVANPSGGILDRYEITVTAKKILRKSSKKYLIYINPYASRTSTIAPEGFELY